MRPCVSARTVVVPVESRSQIVCNPDVVSGGVQVAADDVNDAFLDAMYVLVESRMGHEESRRESLMCPDEYADSSIANA
jgi:hypothetical protein